VKLYLAISTFDKVACISSWAISIA
jgi:hypothetical protein